MESSPRGQNHPQYLFAANNRSNRYAFRSVHNGSLGTLKPLFFRGCFETLAEILTQAETRIF